MIDPAALDFCDSSGLSFFVDARHAAEVRDSELRFARPVSQVVRPAVDDATTPSPKGHSSW